MVFFILIIFFIQQLFLRTSPKSLHETTLLNLENWKCWLQLNFSQRIWYSVFTPLCYNSYYAIDGNMPFLSLLYWYLLFWKNWYGAYDSHKHIFKNIFKFELKLYGDDIPTLICCKQLNFHKKWFSWCLGEF